MPAPLAFLGLPSLGEIIEALPNEFFHALAAALVPDFLKHGTVATIQELVALPDPARWPHVSQLQGEMVYLGAMLLPVTLAIGTLRYWLLGLTGQAHPVLAVGRCTWVAGVLVAYSWIVEEAVAAGNTLTHAILGLPTVSAGLHQIAGVLFGGPLLGGSGGLFGAFLVLIGVVFAAALFACQVMLTVVLAALIVAGPPLIALSAIPELSHLAHAWLRALLTAIAVPVGWTLLFATAGALCLDATTLSGGGAGPPPPAIAAAFAGLVTFALAVRLPFAVIAKSSRLLVPHSMRNALNTAVRSQTPGAARVQAAHARLRAGAYEGPSAARRSWHPAAGVHGWPAGGAVSGSNRQRAASGAMARAGGSSDTTASAPATPPQRPPATKPPRRGVRTGKTERAGHMRGEGQAADASPPRRSGAPGATARQPRGGAPPPASTTHHASRRAPDSDSSRVPSARQQTAPGRDPGPAAIQVHGPQISADRRTVEPPQAHQRPPSRKPRPRSGA